MNEIIQTSFWDDKIINKYFQLIQKRSQELTGSLMVEVFDTFFLSHLECLGPDW